MQPILSGQKSVLTWTEKNWRQPLSRLKPLHTPGLLLRSTPRYVVTPSRSRVSSAKTCTFKKSRRMGRNAEHVGVRRVEFGVLYRIQHYVLYRIQNMGRGTNQGESVHDSSYFASENIFFRGLQAILSPVRDSNQLLNVFHFICGWYCVVYSLVTSTTKIHHPSI